MHLMTSYQHLKQTRNDMVDSNISQIKCNYDCLSIFIYTTEKCSHSLCGAKVNSSYSIRAWNVGFGRQIEQKKEG